MKTALLSLLITAATVLGLSPASAQTNMVKNGDFSLPYDYWANHHFDYHGDDITDSHAAISETTNEYFLSMQVNVHPLIALPPIPQPLSQAIAVQPNHTYNLSFRSKGYQANQGPKFKEYTFLSAPPWQVSFGGQTQTSNVSPPLPNYTVDWVQNSMNFSVGNVTSTVLSFTTSLGYVFSLLQGGCLPCQVAQQWNFLSNVSMTDVTPPSITLRQRVAGGIAAPTQYSYAGTNGWATQFVTSQQAGALGTPTPVQTLTSVGVDTVLTLALPPGLQIANAFCGDANHLATGNTEQNFGSFTNNTFTIPGAKIKPGTVLACQVDVGLAQPRLTVRTVTTTGTGTFTFNGTANANGFSTNNSYQVTTVAPQAQVSGGTVNLATKSVLTEIQQTVPPGWVLTGASCTDANFALTNNADTFGTLIAGTTLQIPAAKVSPGADLQCTFTNAPDVPSQPSITLDQFVSGGIKLPAIFEYIGTNGWTTKSVTSAQGGAYGTPTPVQNLTATGVDTVLTPTLPSGLRITSAYCTDANAANNGNSGGTFGTFTDASLTIPANNIKVGSQMACHVQLGFTQPTLTITKITTSGTGIFTFNGTSNANGFSTNNSYSVTTVTPNVGVSGSTVTLAATNVLTEVQETLPAGWTLNSANCTDANFAVTNNTDTFGTLINGTTLQIPAAKVGSGVDLRCTFTNAPVVSAQLALTQVIAGGSGVPPAVTFNYSGNNGWGSDRPLTSSSEGVGSTGPFIALSANSLETIVTVTLLPGWELKAVNCGDNNGGANSNGGSNFGFRVDNTLHIPAANVVAGAKLQCSMSLGLAPPTIVVNKLMGSNRISNTDQFTVQLKTGTTVAVSGSDTVGLGNSVNVGTGTTGIFAATPGTAYNIGEVMASGSESSLGKYRAAVACSNARLPAGTGTNLGGIAALGSTFTLKAGDVVSCNVSNDLSFVSMTLTQLIISPFPVNLLPPFTFSYTINNGWPVQPQQLTTTRFNVPVSTPSTRLASNNVATTLSANLPDARWFVSSFACSDSNAAITGNPTGNLVRSVGTSISVPADNVRPGSALKCTLIMGHKVP